MEAVAWGVAVAASAAAIFLFWLYARAQKKAGKTEQKLEASEKVIDDVATAKDARDRLRSDPDYARRVRERFTRPE